MMSVKQCDDECNVINLSFIAIQKIIVGAIKRIQDELLGFTQHSELSKKKIVFFRGRISICFQISPDLFDSPTYNLFQCVKSVHN